MHVFLPQGTGHKSKEDVKRWITPERESAIRDCILSAVEEYREKYSGLRQKHSPRTAASTIHDLIEHNIKARFYGDPDVKFVKHRNLFMLIFGNGDVVMRFKKLDGKLNASNIPTRQSQNFSQQMFMYQTSLFEPSINLNAGYQLLEGIDVKAYITCPTDYRHYSWAWELAPIAEAQNVIPIPQQEEVAQQREWKGKEGLGDDEKERSTAD